MVNKTSYKNIEGLIPLENNGGNYIGVKNNQLISKKPIEVLKDFNISSIIPFSINSCNENFIQSADLITENDKIIVKPMSIEDSTNSITIELKETITKSINGLFEEGQNKGCKDNSYTKWNQPIMNTETMPLGHCYQTIGTMTTPAYLAMDGIYNSAQNSWTSSTVNSNWIFTSVIPFITESVVLVNTNTANRTRNLNIYADTENNDMLLNNYFCNGDALAQSYAYIPEENRIESDTLNITTLSTFTGTTVGFNEIIINAKTKYIQQGCTYKLYLITDESQEKIDVLLSSNMTPILPEGFKYFAYVMDISTNPNLISFENTYGNSIKFDTSFPATITNCKYETVILNSINDIKFDDIKEDELAKYTIYLKLNGDSYARKQRFYKNRNTFPENPEIGSVVAITKEANVEAFEYNGEEWIEFNDVPVGEVYKFNNKIISINQFPCNNNFYIQSIENNVWISEPVEPFKNRNIVIPHNLDIEDISDYKFDCVLVCVNAEAGYLPGEMAMGTGTSCTYSTFTPYLTKDVIGINLFNADQGLYVINKSRGYAWSITLNHWKLLFRIWK